MEKKTKNRRTLYQNLLKHLAEDRPLTTFEVSKLCGVVHSTVSNWIAEEKLNAYRTPGGHRRIKKQDLLVFLKLFNIPLPEELAGPAPAKIRPPLPPASPPEPAKEAPPKAKPSNPFQADLFDDGSRTLQKKILIVEDDESISDVLFQTLCHIYPQCRLQCARDGFEAGKQIILFSPDIVLLDFILPGMDGFRVLRNIREDRNLAHTRIIAISAYDNAENRERLLEAGGVDGFVDKPIDFKVLKEQIGRLSL